MSGCLVAAEKAAEQADIRVQGEANRADQFPERPGLQNTSISALIESARNFDARRNEILGDWRNRA